MIGGVAKITPAFRYAGVLREGKEELSSPDGGLREGSSLYQAEERIGHLTVQSRAHGEVLSGDRVGLPASARKMAPACSGISGLHRDAAPCLALHGEIPLPVIGIRRGRQLSAGACANQQGLGTRDNVAERRNEAGR